MEEVVGELFEKVIRDGITYLVKKVVDAAGKKIKQYFRDEDDDGVPDTEEPEFTEEDDEDTESGEGESGEEPDPDKPVRPPAETEEPIQTIGDIVIITPDGPIVLYAESGSEEYEALVSAAEAAWVDKYGAMDKPLHNYSVSEALLFIIACGTVVSLLCKIFKRRKM